MMIKRCGVIFILLLCALPCLADEQYWLEKILVSKSRVTTGKRVLESEYLQNSSIKSIPEAIGLLGIDTQARLLNYGVQTDFSFRGLSFEGLTLLLNGQRINDPQTGHHTSDIPLAVDDVGSIEFDSLRGIVNIVSETPQESKNIFESCYGQYQTKSTRLSVADKSGDLGMRLSLERDESDGFRYDTDFENLIVNLSSNLKLSADQEAFLFLGYNEKEFGAYDFYTPNRGYPSKEWTKTHILNAGLDLGIGDSLLKPAFFWRRHFDKFMLDKTQTKTTYLNHHRSDVYRWNLSMIMPERFFDHFCLNTEFEQERIHSTNLGKHSRLHYSLSMDIEKRLSDGFTLQGILGFENFESFKDKVTGSIILRRMLNRHSFSIGVNYAIRRPTFTELYYQDPTTIGNANLLPEKLLTCQLNYDYKHGDLDSGLAIFFRREDNLINWVRSASETTWQARNMLEANCFGSEIYLKKELNSALSGGFNYSYTEKQLKDSGLFYKYGYNYASHLLNSFLEFDLPFISSLVELQYKKRPRRNGWVLLGLSLWRNINPVRKKSTQGKKLSNGVNKNVRVFCRISNLLNVGYQDIEGIPSPGRWVEAGVRIEW